MRSLAVPLCCWGQFRVPFTGCGRYPGETVDLQTVRSSSGKRAFSECLKSDACSSIMMSETRLGAFGTRSLGDSRNKFLLAQMNDAQCVCVCVCECVHVVVYPNT